ncbi:hypothetical protein N7457_001137 [Penicillium paradoxum]|uniref:uncharacterized protein n=1 Tax=Penicillium paradoxum TaxID=176176 RepID=UPI00254857CD|nr:uncharacterized protein N7457_001137 [Penicillium paradoxum]KAJ5794538.1 hypothetical protein N7457_001137 [Penicillium paradoxum]
MALPRIDTELHSLRSASIRRFHYHSCVSRISPSHQIHIILSKLSINVSQPSNLAISDPPTSAPTSASTTAPQPKPTSASAMGETNGSSSTPLGDLNNISAGQVRPGGAPARVYLNEKVVPYLLDGMKSVARDQPANPLRVLGEFLLQKSNEVEGETKKDAE